MLILSKTPSILKTDEGDGSLQIVFSVDKRFLKYSTPCTIKCIPILKKIYKSLSHNISVKNSKPQSNIFDAYLKNYLYSDFTQDLKKYIIMQSSLFT